MNEAELFWNASVEELKKGYICRGEQVICLLCGKTFDQGIIYPDDGLLYEAERYARVHIEKTHQSVFNVLLEMDKKLTGLSEHQSCLLRLFYQGKSDSDIQQELGIGSPSTIRNHRFQLKEKERQAKIFLVLMELLHEKDQKNPAFIEIHKTARLVDDRYNITEDENQKILRKHFPEGTDQSLNTYPLKEKSRLIILREVARRFEKGTFYTEKEVNQILTAIYADYVILRRHLIDYGFLDRKSDGSQYWRKE